MSLLDKGEGTLTVRRRTAESGRLRVVPEKWLPLLLDAYRELLGILEPFSVRPVIVGAAAYGLFVEFDPTKDVDIALSNPLSPDKLISLLNMLIQALRGRGYRVLSGLIQLGRSADDWVIQIPVVVGAGEVVGLEVFNTLNTRPVTLFETTTLYIHRETVYTLTLESWIASKLTDPNGIDEYNLERLEKATERDVDVEKVLEIIMRTGLLEVAKMNARSVVSKVRSTKLKSLLAYLL